jgi:hypothetical protein
VPTFSENSSARLSVLLGRPVTGRVITAEHRKVIGQVCADAKAAGMPIEQIIVSLKAMFDKIPSDGNSHARAEIRESVIAVCIEEYYRDGNSVPSHDGKSATADGKYVAANNMRSPQASGDGSRSAPPAAVPLTA